MNLKPTISIIGTGALGSALLKFFRSSDYSIKSFWNSSEGSVFDKRKGEFVQSAGINSAVKEDFGKWIFVTTPDDVIPSINENLLTLSPNWSGFNCVHCSGGLTSSLLKPLQNAGANIASMHPIQTFGHGDDESRFKNIYISIEGDKRITEQLLNIVEEMGAKSLIISADEKRKIHIAAVMVSNYIVSLLGATESYLKDEGVEDGLEVLKPLISQTIKNVQSKGVLSSLSGPIARGDEKTVKNHLSEINNEYIKNLYSLLGREAVRIAQRDNRIDKAKADQLNKLL